MAEILLLSLAANVVQFVGFGLKTVSVCAEILKAGSTKEHVDLQSQTAQLQQFSRTFQVQLQSSSNSNLSVQATTDQELLDIAKSCAEISKQLQDSVQKLYTGPKVVRIVKASWSRLVPGNKIDDIRKDLEAHHKLLDTRILISLQTSATKVSQNQHSDFQKLDADLKSFIQKLDQGITNSANLIKQEAQSTRTHVTSEHEKTRQHASKAVSDIQQVIDAQAEKTRNHVSTQHNNFGEQVRVQERAAKCRELMESLVFPSMHAREDQIDDVFKGTCEFIFADPGTEQKWSNFVEWLRSDKHDVYWINGKAGSGKSTLMNFIYHDKRTKQHLSGNLIDSQLAEPKMIGFFFWNAGDFLQKSLQGMLRSLIHQLLSLDTTLCAEILDVDVVLQGRSAKLEWSTKALVGLLCRALDPFAWPLIVFLDGLDEFDEDLHVLLNIIEAIRARAAPSAVKICVSSRPEEKLRIYFKNCPQVRLQDMNEPSILIYVDGWLREHIKHNSREHAPCLAHLEQIIREITCNANGIFLWAKLAVSDILESITNKDSIDMVLKILDDLPSELDDMFQRMWNKINMRWYKEHAILYFRLILLKELPLLQFLLATDNDFQEARRLELFELDGPTAENKCIELRTQLAVRCGGLLEVSDLGTSGSYKRSDPFGLHDGEPANQLVLLQCRAKVQFIHRTARDFVRSKISGYDGGIHSMSLDSVALLIMQSRCAAFLLDTNCGEIDVYQELEGINSVADIVELEQSTSPDRGECKEDIRDTYRYQAVYLIETLEARLRSKYLTMNMSYYPRFFAARDLLGALVEYKGFRGKFSDVAIARISERETVAQDYLNYLLRCSIAWSRTPYMDTGMHIIPILIAKGANPMDKISGSDNVLERMEPWNIYIIYLIILASNFRFQTFSEVARPTIEAFIQSGASLWSTVPVVIGMERDHLCVFPISPNETTLVFSTSPASLLRVFFGGDFLEEIQRECDIDSATIKLDLALVRSDHRWYRVSSTQVSSQIHDFLASHVEEVREWHYPLDKEGASTLKKNVFDLCNNSTRITGATHPAEVRIDGWTEQTILTLLGSVYLGLGSSHLQDAILNTRFPRALLQSVPGDGFDHLPDGLFDYEQSGSED